MGSPDEVSPSKSRPLVAPPTLVLGGGGNAQDSPRASGFVLKPSALSAQTSNLKIYNTPTRINNNNGKPFDKILSEDESATPMKNPEAKETDGEIPPFEMCTPIKSDTAPQEGALAGAIKDPIPESKTAASPFKSDIAVGEVVFGQNLESRVTNVVLPKPIEASISAAGDKDGFVFGQNLHERVANADVSETKAETSSSEELSFAAAACEKESSDGIKGDLDGVSDSGPKTGEKRTLTETAEEHQMRLENEAKKGRLDEVEVVTGEEDESNVLQINCKLYIYEGAQYQERGRGVLRVNDKQSSDDGSIQSRVVMRTQGSLRVVLNTSVWSGMKVEHPSAKSVRLTGQSSEGAIGVFLVQCTSPKDSDQLFNALEWRVQALKRAQQCGQLPEPPQMNKNEAGNDDDRDREDPDEDDDEEAEAEPEREIEEALTVNAAITTVADDDLKIGDDKANNKQNKKPYGNEGNNSDSATFRND